jgi:hypothetical protein
MNNTIQLIGHYGNIWIDDNPGSVEITRLTEPKNEEL